jgi:hypothetical protein
MAAKAVKQAVEVTTQPESLTPEAISADVAMTVAIAVCALRSKGLTLK